ncbi:MAG: T9SS C-terminal target domain-containing protein, partial [Prevotella sp.]|nr:T9SS C-terminal target domain-containing protein [Prevotella sp.]
IVDHCTAAWGTDETVSGRGAKNISFQYSMITEALGITGHKNYADGTNHGYAATIDGKIGSWHHNLLVNCEGRNWSLGGGMDGTNTAIGQMDIFNNVVYNWHNRTTDGGCHEVNFVNNYYKMGPDTRRTQLFSQDYENVGSIESKWQAYVSGNIRENKNHSLSQDKYKDTYQYTLSNGATDPNTRSDQYQYNTFVNKPFFPSHAEIHTAKDALKIVTSYSGATMPMRDEQHVRNVRETLEGSYTYVGSKSKIKGEIDSEADITEHENGKGWEEWPEEHRSADWDTDQDGMPNWWEDLVGSNPQEANQNDDPDQDGWTLLEDYLEFMSHPYLVVQPNSEAAIDLSAHFQGFYGQNGKSTVPVYRVEMLPNGIYKAEVSGSLLYVHTVKPDATGIFHFKVSCSDGETSFTQTIGVAITSNPTGIPAVSSDESATVVSREFFTVDGRRVTQMQPHEVYLMKTTDSEGQVRTVKVIKN